MGVRERHARQGMSGQEFAPAPHRLKAGGASALSFIQDGQARLFDRRLGKVAGTGEPELKRGVSYRVFAGPLFSW